MTEEIRNRIEQIKNGQVPVGYKKIINTIVPFDFEESSFGDLFDFYGGLGIARAYLSKDGVPYLHYGDMHKGNASSVSLEQYMGMPKYDVQLTYDETYLLKDGDVVFVDASEDLEGTSKSVLIDNPNNEPFISGLHTFAAKDKNGKLTKYFKQYITAPDYVKLQFMTLACGFKVYGLNRSTIKKIVFAYPKKTTEQQKIAEILMKRDEAVALQEKLIENLELQKKALMQRLLKPKARWEKIKLGMIGDLYQSETISEKDLTSTGYKVYGANGMIGYYDKYNHAESQIAITCRGSTCGSVLFTEQYSWITGNAMVLNVNENYNKLFIYYLCLNSSFKSIISGSGLPQITRNNIANYKCAIPKDLKVQKKIAAILQDSDLSILYHKQKLTALKAQQKSLMQLLLTGIVRV